MEQEKSYERVIQHIKDEILSGNLRQGQKLPPERELAEQLKVGRNSVREALRTLDILGIISSTQGAGNYMTCNFEKSLVESMSMMFLLNHTNYRQISELRQGIETQAAMLAVDRISEEQLCRLERLVQELSGDQPEERNVALDKQLHYLIAQASENQLIVEILQALSSVIDSFISDLRREILAREGCRELLMEAHAGMVRGLRCRDRTLLEASLREHFRLIEENL